MVARGIHFVLVVIVCIVTPVTIALTLNDIHSYRRVSQPDDSDTLRQALNIIQRRRRMFDVQNRMTDRLPVAPSSFTHGRLGTPSKRQMEEVGDLPLFPDSNEEDILLPLVSASGPASRGHSAYSAVISGKLSKLLRQMENQVQEKRGSKVEESREDQEERVTAAVVDDKPDLTTSKQTEEPKKGTGRDKRSDKRKRQDDTEELRPSPALTKIMPFASLYPDRTKKSPVGKRSSSENDAKTATSEDETEETKKPIDEIDQAIDTPGTARYFHQLHADKKEVVEIRRPDDESSENESVEDFLRKVQELPPTKYFNYASGLEHHSTFWDPSYDSMKLPAGYGEDVEKRKRKRKSGRRVLKDEDYPRDSDDLDSVAYDREEPAFSKEVPSNDLMLDSEHVTHDRPMLQQVRRRKSPGFAAEETQGNGRREGVSSLMQNEQKVLGELKDILKDDDSERRTIKKRGNEAEDIDKRIAPDVKRQQQNMTNDSNRGLMATSRDSKEKQSFSREPIQQYDTEDIMADNDLDTNIQFSAPLESNTNSKSNWPSDKKHFDEWLRQEYYRNMARSMINMKRKKREKPEQEMFQADDVDDHGFNRRRKMSKRSSEYGEIMDDKHWGDLLSSEGDPRSRQYRDVYEKLKNIEDALILEALEIVKQGAQTGMRSEADRQKLSNRLDAAYDLESMRLSLEDLQNTMTKMEKESEAYGEVKNTVSDDNELRRYFEENGYIKKKRSSKRTSETNNPIMIAIPPEELNELESELSEGEECPALELLTSDCSALADVVLDARLQKLFLQACNWHEVCYSCGEAFGLTSSDCDIGFLAQSHTVCQQDAPCETTARLLLSPLRQRRVFYKRSIPDVCYRYSCVQDFLHLR